MERIQTKRNFPKKICFIKKLVNIIRNELIGSLAFKNVKYKPNQFKKKNRNIFSTFLLVFPNAQNLFHKQTLPTSTSTRSTNERNDLSEFPSRVLSTKPLSRSPEEQLRNATCTLGKRNFARKQPLIQALIVDTR